MHRRCWVPMAVFIAVLVAQGNHSGWAQESDRSERYFDYLDRDKDGQISTDEFARMDSRMRERFQSLGFDGQRSISRSRFLDAYRRADEARRQEDDQRRTSGDSRTTSSSSSSSSSSSDRSRGKPKEKVRLTMPLPAPYQALDLNMDDQIGLYEWDPTKYDEFFALDRNGDGFLTPNELVNAPRPTVTPAQTTVAGVPSATPIPGQSTGPSTATTGPSTATTGGNGPTYGRTGPSRFGGGGPTRGAPSTSTAAPVTTPVVAAADPNDDADTRQAKYFFSLTDKDKNGEISAEEWAESRGIRPMFEKASVTPTLPLTQATFVQQYLAIKKK
jgi:Ca2+-binding EF-hand superfamily protein